MSRAMKLSPCTAMKSPSFRCNGRQVLYLLAVLLLVFYGCAKNKDTQPVPEKQGWVSDYADLLKPQDRSRIEAALESYENETCHQIYLLIMPTLKGESIIEFSQRIAKAWEIGQPGFGNGFLVTMAIQEGAVRIETGSAFEWFIQDGSAEKVLNEVMVPLFRQEKFVEGIERGLSEIMKAGWLKPIPEELRPDSCR